MAKKVKVPVLRVTARRPSFRRGGYQFGAQPVDIPLAELDKKVIAALKAEPMLVVAETELEVDAD